MKREPEMTDCGVGFVESQFSSRKDPFATVSNPDPFDTLHCKKTGPQRAIAEMRILAFAVEETSVVHFGLSAFAAFPIERRSVTCAVALDATQTIRIFSFVRMVLCSNKKSSNGTLFPFHSM